MVSNRQVWAAGFVASAVYLVCATIARLNYPSAYSPLANWLSDLGNPLVNPRGAFSYNLGCVVAGLCLIFFSLGLEIWHNGDKKRRILLTITQVTGVISSLALIVSAFFPLGTSTPVHSISAKVHIFFIGFFLSFSATILLKHSGMPKWLAYFGFATALINFIYGAFLHSVFFAEWPAIGLFIVYVLIISGNTLKQDSSRVRIGGTNQ